MMNDNGYVSTFNIKTICRSIYNIMQYINHNFIRIKLINTFTDSYISLIIRLEVRFFPKQGQRLKKNILDFENQCLKIKSNFQYFHKEHRKIKPF